MRPIHIAALDKRRPVLVLTRELSPTRRGQGHGRPDHHT